MTSKSTAPSAAAKASKQKTKKPASKAVNFPDSFNDLAASLLSERPIDSANGFQRGAEKGEKEYIKEVSKRLKKQTKKMDNIKKSEDKIKDLTEEEQATTKLINPDERSKIASKPITSAVFKELNEIHEVLKKVADAEDNRIGEEKAEAEAKFVNAVAEAREQGRQAGLEEAAAKISTVVRFLRLAGYRRQQKSGNDQEDNAIERILVLVYAGDQTAVDTCMKLANGTEDRIDDFDVTFAQIKETAHDLKVLGEGDQSEELETEVVTTEPETAEATTSDVQLSAQGDADDPPAYTAQLGATEESVPLPQSYTDGEIEVPATVPATSITADDAANEEANTIEPVEATPEVVPEAVVHDELLTETAIPDPTSDIPPTGTGSWADDEIKAPEAAASPENKDFQNVEPRGSRRGGRGRGRGRGSHRGIHRGRGGEYRQSSGGNPSRGDGEYRGRGGYRSNRERGDSENRGGHRGRGRGDNQHHQGAQPQQQQQQQPPTAFPT